MLKDEAGQTLVACLESVCTGNTYISPSLGSQTRISPGKPSDSKDKLMMLTQMERTVLEAVAQLKTSKEIARDLDISHRTVQCRRNNICSKLGLKGANQLLQFAKEAFY